MNVENDLTFFLTNDIKGDKNLNAGIILHFENSIFMVQVILYTWCNMYELLYEFINFFINIMSTNFIIANWQQWLGNSKRLH